MSLDPESFANLLIQKMKDEHHVFWIDPQLHSDQHAFLSLLMKEREERQARYRRVQEKIAGSLILSFILVLIGAIGAGALDWLRKHLN